MKPLVLGLLALAPLAPFGPSRDQESGFDEQALGDAIDLLTQPVTFRLEYRTTTLGARHPAAGRFRAFLSGAATNPRSFELASAILEEVRESAGTSDPNQHAGLDGIYVGDTTEYVLGLGADRVYQDLSDEHQSMPVILQCPGETLLYYRDANRLEFHDTTAAMDLRTMSSMASPLPLTDVARDHWMEGSMSTTVLGESEALLTTSDDTYELGIKCSTARPHLPIATWLRPLDDPRALPPISSFISYRSSGESMTPRVILSIRHDEQKTRVDEYRLLDVQALPSDSRLRISLPSDASIMDRTGGRSVTVDSVSALSAHRASLISRD